MGLFLGTLVYFTRAAGALFLTPDLRHSLPPLFGPSSGLLSGSLPSLTHAFSFTLLSTLALGVTRRAALSSAALWLVVETLFEVGQHTPPLQRFWSRYQVWDWATSAAARSTRSTSQRVLSASV